MANLKSDMMDEVLDELEKSVDIDLDVEDEEEEFEDDIEKSFDEDDDDDTDYEDDDEDDDDDDDEDYEDDDEDYEDDEDDDEDYEDDDEDDETEKSFMDEFAQDETMAKALEVSDFLESLVGLVGERIDRFGNSLEKSLSVHSQTQQTLIKSLHATGTAVKSLLEQVREQDELIKSLQNAVEEIASQPVGRKSVLNSRESVQKSFGVKPAETPLRKSQIVDLLVDAVGAGKVSPLAVTKFEASGYLDADTRAKIGL